MSDGVLIFRRQSPTSARRSSNTSLVLEQSRKSSLVDARFEMKIRAVEEQRRDSVDAKAFALKKKEDQLHEKSRQYLFLDGEVDIIEETGSQISNSNADLTVDDFLPQKLETIELNAMGPPTSASSSRRLPSSKLVQKVGKVAANFSSSLSGSLSAGDGTPSSARGKRTNALSEGSLGGPPGLNQNEERVEEEEKKKPDFETDLLGYLMDTLEEVSRQRLRALQMALRRCGASSIDSRITHKDLTNALQENGIKFPPRVYQLMVNTFTDSKGVNFEKLYHVLVAAHNKTGRDSVRARNARNDLKTTSSQMSVEERDADLLRRLEEQIGKCDDYFDLNELRTTCQQRDEAKMGKIQKNELLTLCTEAQIPIYGALLSSVLRRCDDENNGMVSWPELMSFLEKALESWISHNPDKPLPGSSKLKFNKNTIRVAASLAGSLHQSQSSSTISSTQESPATPATPSVIVMTSPIPPLSTVPSTSSIHSNTMDNMYIEDGLLSQASVKEERQETAEVINEALRPKSPGKIKSPLPRRLRPLYPRPQAEAYIKE